jgi:hypothetical protein
MLFEPEQTVCGFAGEAGKMTDGFGLTATEKEDGSGGEQPLARGMTLKVTVAGAFPAFWMISKTLPVPEVEVMETPGGSDGTDQLKVVPATVGLKRMLACDPVQIMGVDADPKLTPGVGSMKMVYVTGSP